MLECSTERTYEVVNKQLTGRKILLNELSKKIMANKEIIFVWYC